MSTHGAFFDELRAHFSGRAVLHDALDDDGPPHGMARTLMREVVEAGLTLAPPDDAPVTPAALLALPEPAQRYLRFMGVPGHPRDRAFRAHLRGRFWIAGAWEDCECVQFNARDEVTRIFHMRLRVKGVLPTYVRDTYVHGRGRMLGRALDLVPVVDDASEAVTVGECVTWLNDAVLLAPSMLLGPGVTFAAVDDGAFDVRLTDAGHAVQARVRVDSCGAVTDFITDDRFYLPPGEKGPPRRMTWRTPVDGWRAEGGRQRFTRAQAVWELPEGPLTYADFTLDPGAIHVNPTLRVD
ncbi:MAG: DUF6544 family protein [Polyangiales bacterium]